MPDWKMVMEHIEIAEGIWVYENAFDNYKGLEEFIGNELNISITKDYLEGFHCHGSVVFYPDGDTPTSPLSNVFANILDKYEKDYLEKNGLVKNTHSPFSIIYHGEGSWYKTMELLPPTSIRIVYVLSTDAVGGDFVFPDLDIRLQLKENTVLIFPESPESDHHVLADKVESGSRILIKAVVY